LLGLERALEVAAGCHKHTQHTHKSDTYLSTGQVHPAPPTDLSRLGPWPRGARILLQTSCTAGTQTQTDWHTTAARIKTIPATQDSSSLLLLALTAAAGCAAAGCAAAGCAAAAAYATAALLLLMLLLLLLLRQLLLY
jgi:hypothetical protein